MALDNLNNFTDKKGIEVLHSLTFRLLFITAYYGEKAEKLLRKMNSLTLKVDWFEVSRFSVSTEEFVIMAPTISWE